MPKHTIPHQEAINKAFGKNLAKLTTRELEVLEFLTLMGSPYKLAAEYFDMKEETFRGHAKHIRMKLEFSSMMECVVAYRNYQDGRIPELLNLLRKTRTWLMSPDFGQTYKYRESYVALFDATLLGLDKWNTTPGAPVK